MLSLKENIRQDSVVIDDVVRVKNTSVKIIKDSEPPSFVTLPIEDDLPEITISGMLTSKTIAHFYQKVMDIVKSKQPGWPKRVYSGFNSIIAPHSMSKILSKILQNDLLDSPTKIQRIGLNYNSFNGISDFVYYNFGLNYSV
jgi:hypothetical protein